MYWGWRDPGVGLRRFVRRCITGFSHLARDIMRRQVNFPSRFIFRWRRGWGVRRVTRGLGHMQAQDEVRHFSLLMDAARVGLRWSGNEQALQVACLAAA